MSVELNDHDFEKISRLMYDLCGIYLHDGKKELVKARLGKRLRAESFKTFSEYYRYVTTEDGAEELIAMIDSLSTNLTSFFREPKHFNKLRDIASKLIKNENKGQIPVLRIWSAGCSTGEEPYSIAITTKEIFEGFAVNILILASDISTKVLDTAVRGIYSEDKVKNIPQNLLKKYFQIGQGTWNGHYRVKQEIRDMVNFKRFNLMESLKPNDSFDIIFCRNVMIYFDKATQGKIVNRFHGYLKEGGYLFIGHSESLAGLNHFFNYVEPSVYRK